ncbi:phosphatase PAP2 family protein [Streptomyces sp. NPDC053499]|uniref:phosphatase PAP2 family protein n=1 Tax=Streptomyces sp. NPDC053499 TaxID=3365707 RepID=UPI0037D14EA3
MSGAIRPRPPGVRQARVAAALGAAAALVIVLALLPWPPFAVLDRQVASGLHTAALEHPAVTRTMRILTDWVWDPWTFRLLLAAIFIRLMWRGKRLTAYWTAGTVLVGVAVQQGLKEALGRERPRWREPVDSAEYAAMPSGHVMTAALACVVLLWLLHERGTPVADVWWRSAVGAAVVSVLGVAFTRVWLGVHWLSDTVVGALLGTAVALASTAMWAVLRPGERLPGPRDRVP